MSNREPDGRSKVVDFAKLGPAKVRAILARPNSGWTPHQEDLAREWLEGIKDQQETHSAQVARAGLSVMRISLWVALAGLAYLAWKVMT